MEFLGNHIMEKEEGTIKDLLTTVVGRSGFENLFEYRGHKALIQSSITYRLRGLGQGNVSKALQFSPLRKKKGLENCKTF